MKKNTLVFTLFSLCLVIIMILASSCGDGGGGDSTSPTTLFNVTGTWEVGSIGLGLMVLYLTQDAQGNITGTVDRAAEGGGWDTGRITSGSNIDNNITINILFDDLMTLILTGIVRDANNMDGTYQSYYDPNAIDTDAWAATRSS